MARSARAARDRPPYVWIVVLVLVCLALAGGYVPLWMQFAERGNSLDVLHSEIKQHLEDRLAAPLNVHGTVRAKKSQRAYDSTFFRTIGNAALDGVKFAELVELSGFHGEKPIGQIKDELAATAPPQESLRGYILNLKDDLVLTREQKDQTNSALMAAEGARDEAQGLLEQKGERLDKERGEAAQKLQEARDNYNAEIARMKELMNEAAINEKKAWEELAKTEERRKEQVAQLQDQGGRLEEKIEDLEDYIASKFASREAAMQGQILQANLLEGVAIISIGQRENVQLGDRFDVMRIGKGGAHIKKAELKVIHVDPLVSRTDIMVQDLEDPIARDDVVLLAEEDESSE